MAKKIQKAKRKYTRQAQSVDELTLQLKTAFQVISEQKEIIEKQTAMLNQPKGYDHRSMVSRNN